jgi:hypothetical protein
MRNGGITRNDAVRSASYGSDGEAIGDDAACARCC